MKLLKLIPAAAIALTSFATLEAKAMKICVYNNAGFVMRFYVINTNRNFSKATGYYDAGQTNCIKMSDIPVNVGQSYSVYYQSSVDDTGSSCAKNKTRQSSDSGTTKTYTVSGTTTNSSCEL